MVRCQMLSAQDSGGSRNTTTPLTQEHTITARLRFRHVICSASITSISIISISYLLRYELDAASSLLTNVQSYRTGFKHMSSSQWFNIIRCRIVKISLRYTVIGDIYIRARHPHRKLLKSICLLFRHLIYSAFGVLYYG